MKGHPISRLALLALLLAFLAAGPAAAAGETVNVDLGVLPAGRSVTLTFEVGVDSPFPFPQDQVAVQGVVTSLLGTVPTDDPGAPGPADPTVTYIVEPAPELVLLGDETITLELGTPYVEPGFTARDALGNDLTDQVQVEGEVDIHTPGTYVLTYEVSNAAGTTRAARTVHVVITPNSYVLLAINSMHIEPDGRVRSGFVGVMDYGRPPFAGGRGVLEMGNRAGTPEGSRVSAPRVRLQGRATVDGTLFYAEPPQIARNAQVADQVQAGPEYWPLVELPEFRTGVAEGGDVLAGRKGTLELEEGAYGAVRVEQKGVLVLAGGEYALRSLEAGQKARVLFAGPATLLVDERLVLGQETYFGPAEGAELDAADILVYVNGAVRRQVPGDRDQSSGRDLPPPEMVVQVGIGAELAGNIHAPRGPVWLGPGSQSTGSFIGRDLVLGTGAVVELRSGWRTPGVIYSPDGPPLVKPALEAATRESAPLPRDSGLEPNYPNPFNLSTTIGYALAEPAGVRLAVYNLLGQQVRLLVSGPQAPGRYQVAWDGRNESGQVVANGVYIYRLTSDRGLALVRRMLLLK